jgi:hypothetical protein
VRHAAITARLRQQIAFSRFPRDARSSRLTQLVQLVGRESGEQRRMIYRYAITLRPLSVTDGGGWLAEVPDLPGCMSDGKDPQETLGN